MRRPNRFFFLLLLVSSSISTTRSWEWTDYVIGGASSKAIETLSLYDISELRPRDIKRRLSRTHGYSADELGRMIDKKDLIHALAFAEEKIRVEQESDGRRMLVIQGIIASLIAVLIVFLWPLIQQAAAVGYVNFIVYSDRKTHEWQRCKELRSLAALVGVLIMGVLDLLQLWLTSSVLLSWVMRSKYFFPIPNIPIRPAQMMGGDIAKSSVAGYGINVGSMAVTWVMRFVYGRVEKWTGQAMSRAYRRMKDQQKAERKAQRRAQRKKERRSTTSHEDTRDHAQEFANDGHDDIGEGAEFVEEFETEESKMEELD